MLLENGSSGNQDCNISQEEQEQQEEEEEEDAQTMAQDSPTLTQLTNIKAESAFDVQNEQEDPLQQELPEGGLSMDNSQLIIDETNKQTHMYDAGDEEESTDDELDYCPQQQQQQHKQQPLGRSYSFPTFPDTKYRYFSVQTGDLIVDVEA